MIRALVVGTDASEWCERLGAVAAAAEFEPARLPGAAVRAFERSPADVVLLCGDRDKGRLSDALEALRQRALGRLVPCIAICDTEIEGVDACVSADSKTGRVLELVAELLGLTVNDISGALPGANPLTGPTPTAIAHKLRQVRHDTYFEILEVPIDASPAELQGAFARLTAKFGEAHISAEVDSRVGAELAEVRDGLEDAFAVLSSDRLRAVYSDPRRFP